MQCPALEDDPDDVGVELGAGAPLDLSLDLVYGKRLSVRAVGEHGVDRVAQHDDARREGDRLPPEPVGVSATVEALVVMAHAADHLVGERGERLQELGAADRVGPDEACLLLRQARRLLDDRRVVHVDLPDVMEERRSLDLAGFAAREPQILRDSAGDLRNAKRMA